MDTQSKIQACRAFLRSKLSAAIVMATTFAALMLLAVCIFWYTLTHALGDYLSQQTEVLGSSLATQAAFNATQSILTNDLLSLSVLLNRLVVDDNILSARVFNKKDELLAEADSNDINTLSQQDFRPNDSQRIYSSSIKFRDKIVGHVLITLNKTPAQETLEHLNSLLLSAAIFISVIGIFTIVFVTKWLFFPINQAQNALRHYSNGHTSIDLPSVVYKEARELFASVALVQSTPRVELSSEANSEEKADTEAKARAQFEINFDAIFEESKQHSCILYFDITNLEAWHEDMTPIQVANLLTPIYRAMFQASETYLGQVHQYKNDSAIILFSAVNSVDNLYIDAVSTAQLFLGLIDKLFENELYADTPELHFHLGLHQGNQYVTNMVQENTFEPEEIETLLDNIHHLSKSESNNKLVISEDIFTLPYIQNRVFTGLPEIIEMDEKEIFAYEVKGMSDKYKNKIQKHIAQITSIDVEK